MWNSKSTVTRPSAGIALMIKLDMFLSQFICLLYWWLRIYRVWLVVFFGVHQSRTPTHNSWRHEMETFSALLVLCAGNSPVTSELPLQRLVTRSMEVFFDQRPNKRLSEQSRRCWFETPSHPLWRHWNGCREDSKNKYQNGWDIKSKYLQSNRWSPSFYYLIAMEFC